MARWDDVEVDSDGDELLDWLWDMPDRYDVGLDDEPIVPSEAAEGAGSTGVRKHIRRPAGPEPVRPLGWTQSDDRPTEAVDSVDPEWDDDYEHGGAAPLMAVEPLLSRFTAREMAAAAAVFLVIVACVGLGYALFSNGSRKAGKPSNLAVGTPTTPVTTFAQGGAALFDPVAADTTTTSIEPTTVPDTSSSVPAVLGATTSTTKATHCTTGCTTTTVAATTTTATTVPATTTTVADTTTTVAGTTTTVADSTTTTAATTTTTAAP